MPQASYYNLNSTYIYTTILFVFIAFMYLMRCHARVHYKLVDINNNTCSDPVAMYFNKKLRRKCYQERMSYVGNSVSDDINSVLGGITGSIDKLNSNIQGLTQKYNGRIEARAEAEKQLLLDKQEAIDNLGALVTKIKDLSISTTGAIQSMKYEYMAKLKLNVKSLIGIANTIVQKLTSSVYTPNYKATRAKYAKAYDQIRKYLSKLLKEKIIAEEDIKDADGNLLMNLTDEMRFGKK